jgi:hypothetical protein
MSLETRIARLEDYVGAGRLWGGADIQAIAYSGYLAGKPGQVRGSVKPGTRRLAAMIGMRAAISKLQKPDRLRAAGADQADVEQAERIADETRQKFSLPALSDPEGIMARFVGIATDGGFSDAELDMLREKVGRQLARRPDAGQLVGSG